MFISPKKVGYTQKIIIDLFVGCFYHIPTFCVVVTVLTDELDQLEHISVERFRIPPSEAKMIEIRLSTKDRIPDEEFIRHLSIHISNTYEGRIIKPSDFLCFEFYGRSLTLEVSKIHTFQTVGLDESMQNMNINDEQFYHISSSTTWNIKNHLDKTTLTYPISNVGGLDHIYEKIMNVIQKSKYQSKLVLYQSTGNIKISNIY